MCSDMTMTIVKNKNELLKTKENHGIPMPDLRYNKGEYARLVDRAILSAARNGIGGCATLCEDQ